MRLYEARYKGPLEGNTVGYFRTGGKDVLARFGLPMGVVEAPVCNFCRASGAVAVCPSRVSGSSETKTYGKSTTASEHEEEPTLPRKHFFGKDSDERLRVFNALHVLVSPADALFSGKLSYTVIARWCRASS
jgi:hypothetical protein